jgi:hypothetical protein
MVIIIGANQYFLRTRRKAQNSAMKLAIKIPQNCCRMVDDPFCGSRFIQ